MKRATRTTSGVTGVLVMGWVRRDNESTREASGGEERDLNWRSARIRAGRTGLPVLTRCSFAPIPSPIPRWHQTVFALLASRPAFGLRLNLTNSASTLPFSRLAQCSFPLWARCSLMRPCRTFDIGGFVVCRYQHSTLQLLPAGATVAGWDIFLPLDQSALSRRTLVRRIRLKRTIGKPNTR